MPLKRFVCPDGQEIKISSCLESGGCRLRKRCLTLPTLIKLGQVREWKGVPSTTQLLKGTYEAFLEITVDYAERPDDMSFKLLGTTVHAGLEDIEQIKGVVMEQTIIGNDNISGTSDLLETEGNWNVLTDYKVSGAYKIAKALGLYPVWTDHPTEVYKQKTRVTVNGIVETRLAGDPKVIKLYKGDLRLQDCKDWILQLNKYRINVENKMSIKINELRIQAIVRDGGTASAKNYGIFDRMYLIPIPILSNDSVIEFFNDKRDKLLEALKLGDWDHKCTDEETWSGRKCADFCTVREYCKFLKGGIS